jgi:hypothetical protein
MAPVARMTYHISKKQKLGCRWWILELRIRGGIKRAAIGVMYVNKHARIRFLDHRSVRSLARANRPVLWTVCTAF